MPWHDPDVRHRLGIAVLGLSFLTLAACGSDGPRDSPTTYSDPSSAFGSAPAADPNAFTVTLPSGWTENRDRLTSRVVAFYTGPTVDGFPVNINVTREDVGRLDVQAYQRQAVAGLKSSLKITNLSAPDTTELDGEDAVRYTFEDTQQGVELKQGQVVVVHHGQGYVFTFTAPVDRFEANSAPAAAIITSLHWR